MKRRGQVNGHGAHGRRGDPRMNMAVNIRMKNPRMKLFEALVAGGFKFPALADIKSNKNGAVDEDNVLLSQRKNQLSRRIRCLKKKQLEKDKLMTDIVNTTSSVSRTANNDSSLPQNLLAGTSTTPSFSYPQQINPSSQVLPSTTIPDSCGVDASTNAQHRMMCMMYQQQSQASRSGLSLQNHQLQEQLLYNQRMTPQQPQILAWNQQELAYQQQQQQQELSRKNMMIASQRMLSPKQDSNC